MNNIELFKSRRHEAELLEACVRQQGGAAAPLRILEAGCGRKWPLKLAGLDYSLTGVDLDRYALEFRTTVVKDLDEAVVGDLHAVELDENGYDVIYSSFVLEHVRDAEHILDNLFKWLKAGGILILRIPDRDSVYGFATRLTPFWFHVLFKKYVQGMKNAGKPGFEPYPTVHEPVVSRQGVHGYCARHRHVIREEYGQGHYLEGRGLKPAMMRLFVRTMALLSFGRLAWRHNNLTYVLEKGRA